MNNPKAMIIMPAALFSQIRLLWLNIPCTFLAALQSTIQESWEPVNTPPTNKLGQI